MIFEGAIKTWQDDRGFGFIEPTLGGEEVFVHIKAFKNLRNRPQIGQRVTFEVELGPKGKKRAINVLAVTATRSSVRAKTYDQPAQWSIASRLAIPIFLVIAGFSCAFGHPPHWLLLSYPIASVLAFVAYAWDKSAARNNAWRTNENTLHLLAIIGGWPGALIAQHAFRHKSSKAEFRVAYWATVAVNVAAFLAISRPYNSSLLGPSI